MGQAISFIESSTVEHPTESGVNETLIFNLATMYDLGDGSKAKKMKLLAGVIAKFSGDSFDASSLKLT